LRLKHTEKGKAFFLFLGAPPQCFTQTVIVNSQSSRMYTHTHGDYSRSLRSQIINFVKSPARPAFEGKLAFECRIACTIRRIV
jgi:hypothetical protein